MPSMGSTIGRYTPTGVAMQCASTQLTHAHLQVWVHRQSYLDVFRKEECVYLAAEATDVLQTLDPSKVYIMGAFVDKNRHKSLCYDRAVAAGVATARLPIGEFVKMRSRKVLTTNHGVWLWVAVGGCAHRYSVVVLTRTGQNPHHRLAVCRLASLRALRVPH